MGNALSTAIVDNIKLPRVIVVVLDDDIIEAIQYRDFGVSTCYGLCVESLVKNVKRLIDERKSQLPNRAIREFCPDVYWVELPHHKNFEKPGIRAKFNNCLLSVVKLYKGMRVIKMKEIWNYTQDDLVRNNKITEKGLCIYWKSVDAAIRFNMKKGEEVQAKKKWFEQRNKQRLVENNQSGRPAEQTGIEKFFARKKLETQKQHKFILPKPPAKKN